MKKIKIFAFLLLLVFTLTTLSACGYDTWQTRERVTEETGVVIPADTEIVYHYFDNVFNGFHSQFTVYKFEKEPTDWLKENSFSDVKNPELEEDFFPQVWWSSGEWYLTVGNREVPDEYIPNFDNAYYWLKIKRVYFFYYPDTLMLMVSFPG